MFIAEKRRFFTEMGDVALTYDDVRLRTRASEVKPLPEKLDLTSRFSEHVGLKIPFVSAAMDTVTDGDMAIAMAMAGGLGVIHAAMPIEDQVREVHRVKVEVNGLIEAPVTVREDDTLESVLKMCDANGYSFRTFPVLNKNGKFIGVLTGTDFKYPDSLRVTVGSVMTDASKVTSAPVGTALDDAYRKMQKRRINTLPLIDAKGTVSGMYIFSDVSRIFRNSQQYNVDKNGRLCTAAAVSTGTDALTRIEALQPYLDVVVIDTADGDSYYAFETLREVKKAYPDLDVVVGNISEGTSARKLAEAGANGIKVGQGPGSICTTRRETGIGMPQVTAIYDCVKALGEDFKHIPVCADGGIKDHGDISIAIAVGASSVMMGRMLAGTKEAPGIVMTRGDGSRVKVYRGMGSMSALRDNEASRRRYAANGSGQFLPEGVESYVPYEGLVSEVVERCTLALTKSMRYVKVPDIESHRRETRLMRITNAGLAESHPHDVDIIK
jgi:IMP dehydrogenase